MFESLARVDILTVGCKVQIGGVGPLGFGVQVPNLLCVLSVSIEVCVASLLGAVWVWGLQFAVALGIVGVA